MKDYKLLNCLHSTPSVCIITHLNPDADALCSAFSLKELLKNHFKVKKVDVFCEYIALNKHYLPLIDKQTLNPKPKRYDYAISVDSSSVERLGKYSNLYLNTANKIVIDHHPTNDMQGDIKYLQIVSSTCEIINSIMQYFNYTPTSKTCERLYAGLITDTNNFMVGAISNNTFNVASALTNSISPTKLSAQFFMSSELKDVKLYGKVINNIKSLYNDRIIISYISKNYVKQNNITPTNFDGIINKLSTIENAVFICFIRPDNQGWYVSMRAKENKDVSLIAKSHGGGGHVGAAAYLSNKPLKDVIAEATADFVKQL